MPYGTRNRFTRKRRRNYRRRLRIKKRRTYRKPRLTRRILPVGGFTASKVVRLRYFEEFNLDPDTISPASRHFRCASPYDPSTIFNPLERSVNNWSQWSRVYERYCVLGSKCTVKAQSAETLQSSGGSWILMVAPERASYGSIKKEIAMGTKWVNPYKIQDYSGNTVVKSMQSHQVKTWSAKKAYKVRNPSNVDNLTSAMNQNPANIPEWTFNIYAYGNNEDDPATMSFRVWIDYIVLLTGLRPDNDVTPFTVDTGVGTGGPGTSVVIEEKKDLPVGPE